MMFETTNFIISSCVAIFIFGSFLWCRYLVKLKDKAFGCMAAIDVALQKRHKIAPEIVQISDKFMHDQRELISDIIELLMTPPYAPMINDINGLRRYLLHAENLGEMMHFLLALAPQYSNYQEDPAFEMAVQEYFDNEAEITRARKAYNAAISKVRIGISLFPASLYAHMMNIREMPEYKQSEAADVSHLPRRPAIDPDFED